MKIIFKISLRNLVRQKRRNLLLGLGIAFGMCLLVLANSLGSGISDLLLNGMVESFSAHIFVKRIEKDEKKWNIIRDKEWLKQSILENVDGVKVIREKISAHGKALGNGKSLYISVIGIDPQEAFYQGTPVLAGKMADLLNPKIENPIALYGQMAEKLNVQVNDIIRMRFESVYGQVQTARFTVVAIMKAINPFLNMLSYCHFDILKPLMGYSENETNCLRVILDSVSDPQRAIEQANRLHNALQPGAAGYIGTIHHRDRSQTETVVAVLPGQDVYQKMASLFDITAGDLESTFQDEHKVVLSQATARSLGIGVGDEVQSAYATRSNKMFLRKNYQVGAIFKANEIMKPDMMFIHADQMYETVFPSPPEQWAKISSDSAIFPVLLKQWTLLDRTLDQTSSEKKYQKLGLTNWRGAILDVQTIHEVSSDVLEFEKAISLITIIGVVILFFIIQIGVVNTLRMTIRERTREIGTVRAIGMHRREVQWMFITEVTLLTLFACLAGIAVAFILMGILRTIPINAGGSEMGFFLMNNHLYFVTRLRELVRNLVLILGIAFLTAYFPSRKAARLSVVEALRHYE